LDQPFFCLFLFFFLTAPRNLGDRTVTFPEMVKMLGNILLPLPWWVIYPLTDLAWILRLSFVTKFPSPPLRMMVTMPLARPGSDW
jgi:hypothetical protein